MKLIWGDSTVSKQGRDRIFARTLESEKELLSALESGQFTMEDKPMIQWS